MRVQLDGHAIKTTSVNKPILRYPLTRVSRIIVSGNICWDTIALKACMELNIPITFLHDNGRPIGMVIGYSHQLSSFNELIEAFIERPDWSSLYKNWFYACQRNIILSVLSGISAPDRFDLRPKYLHNQFFKLATKYCSGTQYKYLLNIHKSCLTGLVCETIQTQKISSIILTARQQGLNLIADFIRLLSWYLKPIQLNIVEKMYTNNQFDKKYLDTIFEENNEHLVFKCRNLINNLECWLRSIQ